MNLYHHPICPLSRQVRVYLQEIKEDFSTYKENYWQYRPEFIQISPFGILPVLVSPMQVYNAHSLEEIAAVNGNALVKEFDSFLAPDQIYLVGLYPIIEYLAESDDFFLMPKDMTEKARVRMYLDWFNNKFYREVTKIIIDEKLIRFLMKTGNPRIHLVKAAKDNLAHHLRYLSDMLSDAPYIASETISCADIAAASHISVLDYFGEINWDNWPEIKHWYSIIKSRPSFKPLLQDIIAGFVPPKQYNQLDF